MSGSCRVLSHTADTAIEVEADTLGELYEWAGRGMFGLMFDLDVLVPSGSARITVDAPSADELLVDLLSELLYVSERDDVVPCRFSTYQASTTRVELDVAVAPLQPADLEGPPIKAVTYHGLSVQRLGDNRYCARVVFDV